MESLEILIEYYMTVVDGLPTKLQYPIPPKPSPPLPNSPHPTLVSISSVVPFFFIIIIFVFLEISNYITYFIVRHLLCLDPLEKAIGK